ncbi:hypothetical protein LCGC14_2222180, partial [marine sediment metagenome]
MSIFIPAGTAPDAISQSNPFNPTTAIPSSISLSETEVTTPFVKSRARNAFRMFVGRPICIAVALVFGRIPLLS